MPRSCGGEDQQERAWTNAVLEKGTQVNYDATAFHEKMHYRCCTRAVHPRAFAAGQYHVF